jgi:Ca-activated chloride channel family protein
LKYQKTKSTAQSAASDEWLNIKFRYKHPEQNDSRLIEHAVTDSSSDEITDNYNWSAAVASFGMILRDSEFKGESSLELVRGLAAKSIGTDTYGYRAEFLRLVEAMDLFASKD